MVQHLNKYSYEATLRCLNLPTIKYKRLRWDMIQVYNIQELIQRLNSNLSHAS